MATSKIDVWMPIYIGDYLRDTQGLTAEEHGVYLLLLMHYWQKKGEIGDDIKRLSIVAKSNEDTTKYILESFFYLEDGNYRNKRSDKEIRSAQSRSESARSNIRKRWDKQSDTPVLPANYGGNTTGGTESIRNAYGIDTLHLQSSSEENIRNTPNQERHEYGSENNVLMTDAQYSKLVSDLGEDMAKACIEELSEAKAMKGYKYKRDDLAIRKWVVDAVKKKGIGVPRETRPEPVEGGALPEMIELARRHSAEIAAREAGEKHE